MAAKEDIGEYFEAALEVAKKAGAIARDAFYLEKQVEVKETTTDLVTETDKEVEKLIITTLKQKFPTHKFIGEEETADTGKGRELTDEPTWMIDPIDGTSNFIHRFPFTAVSIGLAIKKEAVVGVVYAFVLDQLYAAKKGGGSTLNGKPIHVSHCTELTDAMLLTEFGARRKEEVCRPKLEAMFKLAVEPNPVCGIRSLGSAAINICMVACGSADAYYEYGVHCWDICAGELILREAGGVSMMPTGGPLDLMKRGVLCTATRELATQIIPHVQHIHYSPDPTDY